MKKVVFIGVIAMLTSCLLLWLYYRDGNRIDERVIRRVYYDTIRYYKPVARDSVVARYVTRVLPVARRSAVPHRDTLCIVQPLPADCAKVVIPITQKRYEDSSYTAWVSGYEVALDSIFIRQRTITIDHILHERSKRWGIGLQVGYGFSKHGASPYVGIGFQYHLFNW